jgi:predicted metal-dependent phosphoesterase TrpH
MSLLKRGSRWWKFDFHTHTPHSVDSAWHPLVGGADELTPSEWLRKFMEAGIDCVAVTDHNGGDWIDRLRSELERLNNLHVGDKPSWHIPNFTIFPGVEISVFGGLHILAVFSPNETTAKVNHLLSLAGYAGIKGDPEPRTSKSVIEVAKIIHELGGICIPAHVDRAKGLLLRSPTGQLVEDTPTVNQVLQCQYLSALEVVDSAWAPPHVLMASKLNVPFVVGTDCHNFRDTNKPGSRFTWIKMGKPCFEGLKLALIDGQPLSVQRSDAALTNPNTEPDLFIEGISISNLYLMGRGSPAETGFSPWLTTIIGGRGTGKSTIIDCLRIVFDRVGNLPDALKADFGDFNKIASDRRSRGAMLEDSTIVVTLRKANGRFRLTWNRQDPRTKIESMEVDGSWRPSDGMVRQRFPIRIMSQKEIFEVAKEPQSLINLVDSSPDFTLNDWRERRDFLNAKYKRLVGQQRELFAKTAAKQRLKGEYEDCVGAIAIFEQGENRQTLQEFQVHRRQERILEQRPEEIDELALGLKQVADAGAPSDIDEGQFAPSKPEHQVALKFLRESHSKHRDVVASLTSLVAELDEFNEQWKQRLGASTWTTFGASVQTAYDTLVAQLAANGVANANAYAPLIQKRQQLDKQLKEIESAERDIQRLSAEIDDVLREIVKHRIDLSTRRETFLSTVLDGNPFVRVRVMSFGGNPSQFESSFREAIGRADGFKSDIYSDEESTGLLFDLYDNPPADPAARSEFLATRISELKSRLLRTAETGNDPELTQRFANYLQKLSPDELDKIRLWFPEDSLEVDYKRGNDWASIEQGSPGQQTAAILAFLMSHGREPMILDQPEDDLDNHLIYDLVVRQIRQSKQERQIIIATHNPNIVVNGDAEMVIAMASRNGQCIVNEPVSGALQESAVRDEVCKVMEGGRDAFLKRYQRIVYPGAQD